MKRHRWSRPTGFREYDARWLIGSEFNLMGAQALGLGIGTLLHERGVRPDIVVGHDFRSYSQSIKLSLVAGLMTAGIRVHDVGLAVLADGVFRAVRARCPGRGDGDGKPQRQRLDRRQDGRGPAADPSDPTKSAG